MCHWRLIAFATWDEVLTAARAGVRLWYGAPMDAAQAHPYRAIVVARVYANGKLRIDPMSHQLDDFTADAAHLDRFRRQEGK